MAGWVYWIARVALDCRSDSNWADLPDGTAFMRWIRDPQQTRLSEPTHGPRVLLGGYRAGSCRAASLRLKESAGH